MIKKLKEIFKLNSKKNEPNIYAQIDEMFDTLGVDEISVIVGEDLILFAEDICGKISELRTKIKDKSI